MPTTYAGPAPRLRRPAKDEPAKVRPSLALRVRVRWNAARLDAALADGADPGASKDLALRSQQLVDPKHRARLAGSIERLLALTERGGVPQLSSSRAPFQPDLVEGSRPQLRELGERLEAADSPPIKGVAMATLMVEDGTGALYVHEPADPLRPAVQSVLAALRH